MAPSALAAANIFDTRSLTSEFAQIVELGAAHAPAAHDLNPVEILTVYQSINTYLPNIASQSLSAHIDDFRATLIIVIQVIVCFSSFDASPTQCTLIIQGLQVSATFLLNTLV